MSKLKLFSFVGLVVAIVTTLIILPACEAAEPEVVVETVTETVVETVTETVVETVTEEAGEAYAFYEEMRKCSRTHACIYQHHGRDPIL